MEDLMEKKEILLKKQERDMKALLENENKLNDEIQTLKK